MWSKFKKKFRIVKSYHNQLYLAFRILVGLLFAQHGAQKLLGWFGGLAGNGLPVKLISLMGLAGIIELAWGLAIALGLFTRLAACFTALEMVIAYAIAHATKGLNPLSTAANSNGGELELLYIAAFLVLMAYGAKKWGLEKAIFKKEMF